MQRVTSDIALSLCLFLLCIVQVKVTVASMASIDAKLLYIAPIETAPSRQLDGVSVTDMHWFERRHELKLKLAPAPA